MLETDLPYVSLWYTIGGSYEERDGETSILLPRPRPPRRGRSAPRG